VNKLEIPIDGLVVMMKENNEILEALSEKIAIDFKF